MARALNAIQPAVGGMTVTATSTTSTAAVALGQAGGDYIFSAVGADAFIRFGISTVGAAAATSTNFDVYVQSGGDRIVTLPPSVTHFRVISSGTGNLYWGKAGN